MNKHIFIVDDSQTVLKTTAKYLEETDFTVHTFDNANDALDAMETTSPHFILLDYFMPEMNGDVFMVKVSERLLHYHDWQVLLISSHDFSAEEKLSMMTLGIAHIFKKPMDKTELLKVLNESSKVA